MKFALLGCNDHALPLVRALREQAARKDHDDRSELVAAFDIPDRNLPEVRSLAPRARFQDEWESLLHGTVADAVIVTGRLEDDGRADQLRKLSQVMPLVVVQPCCEAIVGYELDMIRSDAQFAIVPYVPGRYHPLIQRFARLVAGEENHLGSIHQIVFSAVSESPQRDHVLSQFCRDVALIRGVTGHLTELIATGVKHGESHYGGLSVNFACESELSIRWTLESKGSQRQILLVGEAGEATLLLNQSPNEWKLVAETITDDEEASNWPAQDLEAVISCCRNPEIDLWLNGCRDLEAADTVDYSLRRGRKISLISEAPSEEGTFKGVMAASGCLLLLLSFFAVIGLSMVEGFRYPGKRSEWESRQKDAKKSEDGEPSRWPLFIRIWPVYPLLLFLVLQIFRLAAKPSRPATQSNVLSPPSDDGT